MAFCRNCGSEIPDGTKFCPNCGTSVELITEEINSGASDELFYTSDVYRQSEKKTNMNPASKMDKYGKYFGIILMILAFVDFESDPAILTIVLSVAIIAGCIFCLGKKYKLKGFTIVALIFAAICLISGISQAKMIGLFRIADSTKVFDDAVNKTSIAEDTDYENDDIENVESEVVKTDDEAAADEKETEDEDVSEVEPATAVESATDFDAVTASESVVEKPVEDTPDTVNGVDPDLVAFLDSYEAFIDEYVVFMEQYLDDPGNAVSMLSDYMDIMLKYEDFAQKVDKYNADSMSTEDAKYYLEVINRCNQKMLEIYY